LILNQVVENTITFAKDRNERSHLIEFSLFHVLDKGGMILTLIVFELGWRLRSRLLLLFEMPPKRHGVAVVHDGTTVRKSNNRLWIARAHAVYAFALLLSQ
jgi:hypothetical protein